MAEKSEKTLDVFGIGNPIMDIIMKADDKLLERLGLEKGAMKLLDEVKLEELEDQIEQHSSFDDRIMIPGGSVANTAAAMINLGGKAGFCGMVGNDLHSEVYKEKLKDHGVLSKLVKAEGRTGQAITFITPDSERTFAVHLGVADKLKHSVVLEEDIARAKVLHISGYVIDSPETRKAALQAMEYAKKHNTLVSLDLSDHNLAKKNKEIIKTLIKNYVDIIFANELEAEAYTGKSNPEDAAIELSREVKTVAVKIGKEGSFIVHNGELHKIQGYKANAVDTTGAGDMFAAGFLYGINRGFPIEKAGKIGSYAAARIVEMIGARLEHSLKGEIKNL